MSDFKQSKVLYTVNSTVSSGGTLTLVFNSARYQQITGTQNHVVVLPDTTTLPKGIAFAISNRGSGIVVVNFNGGSLAKTLAAGTQALFTVYDNSSALGDWDVTNEAASGAGASLSSADKIGAIAGLGQSLYKDAENTTARLAYNPEEAGADSWINRASLLTSRYYLSAFDLNGYAYATGGVGATTIVERFDDVNDYWLARASTSVSKEWSGNFGLNGFGYAVGNDTPSAIGEKYNDSLNTWASIASLAVATGFLAMMTLDGFGFLAGGYIGSVVGTSQIYSDANNAWYIRSPQGVPVYGAAGAVLNGRGYVIGGDNAGFSHTGTTQYYLSDSNAWTTTSAVLNTVRQYLSAFSLNGALYAGPGYNGSPLGGLEEFYDITNAWKTKSSVGTTRFGAASSTIGGNAFLAGGSTTGGGSATAAVESYRNASFVKVGLRKKSTLSPSAILVSATIRDLALTIPARIRTDGDTWRNLIANSDSALKTGETLKGKFQPTPLLYIAGGTTAAFSTSIATTEFYNPNSNVWTFRSSMVTARGASTNFNLNGTGYLVGGVTAAPTTVGTVEKYDEQANAYSSSTAYPTIIYAAGGFAINGFGYVAGGEVGSNSTAAVTTSYKFDDVSLAWTAIASLNTAEEETTGFTLLDRGYVVGGTTGAASASTATQQYNVITNSWATKAVSPSGGRYNAGFSLNGYGYNGCNASAGTVFYRYDQELDSWSSKASLGTDHSYGGSSAANGVGYYYSNSGQSAVVESYNDAANLWTSIGTLNTGRRQPSKGFSPGAYRNYEVQLALPSDIAGTGAGVWTAKASLLTAKRTYSGFVVGGYGYFPRGFLSGAETVDNQRYDIALNAWTKDADAPAAAYEQAAGSMLGYGFTMGGQNVSAVTAGNYRYDPSNKTWATRTAYSVASQGVRCCPLNGLMYRMGGNDNSANRLSTVESFNDSANAWTARASMSSLRGYPNPFNKNGFLYVANGQTTSSDGSNLNTSEYYDDASNAWTARANTASAKRGSGYGSNSGVGFITGGNDTSGSSLSQTETYNADANVWNLKASLPIANSAGPGLLGIQDRFIQGGGNTGADTAVVQEYSQSLNELILSLGLRVTES